MCGRFNLFTNPRLFAEVFAVARTFDDDWGPAYNIAPTQKVLCIRDSDQREFFKAKWGLIPGWAKDAKIGSSCINARVETVDTKPAFRSAFTKRRVWSWLTASTNGARQISSRITSALGLARRWHSPVFGSPGSLQKAL
ncbi:MAG TPA: SOS response-associated peptidase family protein [Pirellulales bacterium]|jgi:putative SOS response-associated peptidase YedK